jgi:two-component system phosphate regulon response regulator PhoB
MSAAHVLVIENDAAIQQLIAFNLGLAGHVVSRARDAESALMLLEDSRPDLILLDWTLPGQSGLALVRRLRAQPRTRALPVMMVTARASEADKIMALEGGADDYMTKPFSPREMVARVHALLRRIPSGGWPVGDAATAPAADAAGLRLDPHTLRVMAGARELALGRVEFKLLDVLMRHPGRVHTRAQLLDQVWGNAVCLEERTVDTHVGRLRSALQPAGYQRRIETVRGSGYRFVGAGAYA